MRPVALLFTVFVLAALPALARADAEGEVNAALDGFHAAAAAANQDAYEALMTEDVVFLGTDGSERWQGEAFRRFVGDNFSRGRGWQYTPTQRNVSVSADGRTAWFDEALENASLGNCRGSGVLVKGSAGWQIAQYNLSVPIPNGLVDSVSEAIRNEATTVSMPPSPAAEAEPAEAGEKKRCPVRHKTVRAATC